MNAPQMRKRAIYHVTLMGSLINFGLLMTKFLAGILGQSAAMIADAVHSLSDFATDVVVMLFVRLSSKPQDEDHEYGHGKYETLATAVIGLALFAVGLGILWNGVKDIWAVAIQGETLPAPGMWAFWAAIASIVLKEFSYQITVRVGRRWDSAAVVDNAWHHRSDAFSSIGTALGIGGAILLGDAWHVLDPLAATVVSFFILRVAITLLIPSVNELTESALPGEVEREIERTAMEVAGVTELHNLRTRRIGGCYAIEMHVRMDGSIPLLEAHQRATEVERKLKRKYGPATHVGIHVEPIKINGVYCARPDSDDKGDMMI